MDVFTGLLSQALHGGKWRRAQRASALNHGLSAIRRPQAIGGSRGRVGEQRSRAGPSVQPALTGQAKSRERLYRASLSGSAGRKVAARATRKCPKPRPLSNHEAPAYRRFDRSCGADLEMRRPRSQCMASNSRPPSWSRSLTQRGSTVNTEREPGSQKAVGKMEVRLRTKPITDASYG